MNNDRFESLVVQAVESLPEEFRDRLENIDIMVADRPTREQERVPRDIAVVLARLVSATGDDVVDHGRVQPRALGQRFERVSEKIVGPHLGERAAVAADRRPNRVDDDYLLHAFWQPISAPGEGPAPRGRAEAARAG